MGVRIPRPIAQAARLRAGDSVELELEDGAIVIRPSRGRPRLKDLVDAITPENLHPETDWGAARGKEAW